MSQVSGVTGILGAFAPVLAILEHKQEVEHVYLDGALVRLLKTSFAVLWLVQVKQKYKFHFFTLYANSN